MRWKALLLLGSWVAWAGWAHAQDETPEDGAPRDPASLALAAQDVAAARRAASRGLRVISALAGESVYSQLGFEDSDDLARAELASPIPVFRLNLEDLRSYRDGDDPSELLTRSDEIFFPVLIAGEVRSSITVETKDGAWTMTAIGQSHLTRTLVLMQRELGDSAAGPIFVVHVPALYQMFLVHGSGGERRFVPVYGNPLLKTVARQVRPSEEVFETLREFARDFRSPLGDGSQ